MAPDYAILYETEIVNDLDIQGWDFRKSLRLLAKSNAPLLEWLVSPIVYCQHPIMKEYKELALNYFSSKRAIGHYLALAKRNNNQYIVNKTTVKQKKYLYVLRALFAAYWVFLQGNKNLSELPPMQFQKTLSVFDHSEFMCEDPIGVKEAIYLNF